MSDNITNELIKFILSSNYESIVIPDELYHLIATSKKGAIPYIGLEADSLRPYDLVVVHKGLMHRLGYPALCAVSFNYVPIYADEVYVCFAHAHRPLEHISTISDIKRHLPPITDYLHSEPLLFEKRPADQKTAVLVSAFGVNNIGDDLVSYAAKKMLEDIGVASVSLSGPSATYDAIKNADIVAVGGGGLFYDSDMSNVANYLYPIQEAQRQNKPAVILGVGIQGITTPLGKKIYAHQLKKADFISVRDPKDKEELVSIDPEFSRTIISADMAFYLADYLRARVGSIESSSLALFSLSSMLGGRLKRKGYNLKEVSIHAIRTMKTLGYETQLVLHSEDDRALFEELSREENVNIIEIARYGIVAAARLYAEAGMIVTSRYHALILGVIFNKPVVSVYSETGKTGKLIASYLSSISTSCQPLDSFSLEDFSHRLKNPLVASYHQVTECVSKTYALRAKLASITNHAFTRN